MNIREAFDIFELPKTATKEEVKAKYKQLAKKFHPDLNKDKKDDGTFAKINQAKDLIDQYHENPAKFDRPQGFGSDSDLNFSDFDINLQDIINGFGGSFGGPFKPHGSRNTQRKQVSFPPIEFNVNISFKESVIGTATELKYKKYIKCGTCNSNGKEAMKNGCTECDGFGKKQSSSKNITYVQTCDKCYG
jgi:molecular chaperone DnaJ